MVSLFLLLGCNLSYIVDLFVALHELASASAGTLLKLASSVRALLKPYGDTLTWSKTKVYSILVTRQPSTQSALALRNKPIRFTDGEIIFSPYYKRISYLYIYSGAIIASEGRGKFKKNKQQTFNYLNEQQKSRFQHI